MNNAKFINACIHACADWGILPTAFNQCMTWEEQVLWIARFLQTEVIPTVNENTEAFNALKAYVENYFDNLDVQEEINNKLDDMAESGELADIIAAYINLRGILAYDTVADMKVAENLVNGSFAETYGFNARGDGGSAKYKIRTITNDDVVDEMSIIELADDTLIAELVASDSINVKQLGAKGDGTTDDSTALSFAINNFNNVTIPSGTYLVSSTITVTNNDVFIQGVGEPIVKINTVNKGIALTGVHDIRIDGVDFTSPKQKADGANSTSHILSFYTCYNIKIENCKLYDGKMGIVIGDSYNIEVNNNIIHDFNWGLYLGGNETISTTSSTEITNCKIYNNICYNAGYDGIKFTGYIKNVEVFGNTCYGNTRDGIDFAGQSVNGYNVHDNEFYGNTLCGSDFKVLNRSTYPFDITKTKQIKNVMFSNNICHSNLESCLNFQLGYSDNNYENIVVANNILTVNNVDETTNQGTAIRVAPFAGTIPNAFIIRENKITGEPSNYAYGIRLTATSRVLVYNNEIYGTFRTCCYVDYIASITLDSETSAYNTFDNNIIENIRGGGNAIGCGDNTTYITITNNKVHTPSDAYMFSVPIFNESTNVVANNEDITHYATKPSGRATKGVIYPAQDAITAGVVGWIGTENGTGSGKFRDYISTAA